MTDFGANIFDDAPRPEPTPTAPTRKPRSRKKQKAPEDSAVEPPAAPPEQAPTIAAEPPNAPELVAEPELPTAIAADEAPTPNPARTAPPDDVADAVVEEVHNPFPPAERYTPDEPLHDRERQPHPHRHGEPRHPRGDQREPRQPHGDRRGPHDREPQHGRDRGQRHGQPSTPRPAEADRARPQHPQQQQQQHHQQQPKPPQPRPPVPAAQKAPAVEQAVTVHAVIDLDLLLDEAQAQQGELAMARLRLGLAGTRTFGRGIALARNRSTPPAGFGLELFGDDFAGGVRLAGAAFGLAGPDRVVVLAPATKPMLTLARALHAAGHKVEVCGFTNPENHPKVRLLGRECLFVP